MNMFRIILTIIFLLSASALAQPTANDADACNQDSKLSIDLRIAACTRAINSGKYPRESLAGFHFHRGIAWQNKTDYKNALADFETAARLNPKDRDTFSRLGQVNSNLKNFPVAIAHYSEALRIGPPTALIYVNRAIAKRILTDLDAAIADLNEAIKLAPDRPLVYTQRGLTWLYKKEFDKSIADFSEAIRLDPNDPEHLWWRSNAWYRKGNFTQSLMDINAYIESGENNSVTYNHLAWLLATAPFSLRNGERAVQYAIKANELSQWNDPDYMDTLAAAHAEAGNFTEAIRWQIRAMEFPSYQKRSDFPEAQQRLELYRKGQPYRMARPNSGTGG